MKYWTEEGKKYFDSFVAPAKLKTVKVHLRFKLVHCSRLGAYVQVQYVTDNGMVVFADEPMYLADNGSSLEASQFTYELPVERRWE